METVSTREAGGRHRQADDGKAAPPTTANGHAHLDDLPTETLPRAVEADEPATEAIDGGAVQAGADGPAHRDGRAAETAGTPGTRPGPPPAAEPVTRPGPPPAAEPPARSEPADAAEAEAPAAEDAAPDADEPPVASDDDAAGSPATPAHPAAADVDTPADADADGGADHDGDRDGDRDDRPAPVALTATPPPGRGRRGARVAAAAVALIVVGLVSWLVVTLIQAAGEEPVNTGAATVTAAPAGFGEEVAGPDGWSVAVALPEQADAAGELPDGADRAVRMEITLTNDAGAPRDSAGWTVKATADGRAVELLPTDGRATTAVPSRTVLPGSVLRFAVEVPMPSDEAELQLEAALPGSPPVLFVGPA